MEEFASLKVHLLELEEKLLLPEFRTSKKKLMNILSDQFFEIGSSGRLLYKNESITEDGIGIVDMKLSDFEIHPLSNEIMLATYRIYNENTKQHTLRSSIWKYAEGRWQLQFHQGTKTESR